MITLLTDQEEADRGFRKWVDALLGGSTATPYGWIVDGKGLAFSNYSNAPPGEIGDQVMLGVDPDLGTGTVKLVRPVISGGAKRKLTLMGRDDSGRLVLVREGRLTGNRVSRLVVDGDFARLSRLEEVPVLSSGMRSDRHWYVVAALDATPDDIVSQTVRFANACARARSRAGGASSAKPVATPSFGMDEKGSVTTVTRKGGSAEVVRLQGYVFEQLKRKVGADLRKPSRGGFCVDGYIAPASLLIEMKTGTSPHDIYEAVGQLGLYPSLIGLPDDVDKVLLVPDDPAIKPAVAAALETTGIEVYTYAVRNGRGRPRVTFPKAFLERCLRRTPHRD